MRGFNVALGIAFAASLGFAAVPIASVSSALPFNLDGTMVSNPGVNSWPVVINDDIATFDAGAVLKFEDGSRVAIAANSRLQLQGTDANPRVVLVAGKMSYNLAAGSRVSVLALTSADADGQSGADQGPPSKKHDHDQVPADTLSRETQFLRIFLPVAFAGLGIATDAILQPGSAVSPP